MRPLIIVDNDPEIQRLSKELITQGKVLNEKLKFIDKQRNDANAETVGRVWNEIEDYLAEKGLLPEENKRKAHLSIQNGVLYETVDGDSSSINYLESFLGGLLTPH